MSINFVANRLAMQQYSDELEEMQALREITQEIVLASLGRTDFFSYAAFQGGTCLRIFHGLDRFSEDLDFTLVQPDPKFSWGRYRTHVENDLQLYGYQAQITDRSKADAAVKLVFIKDDAIGKVLQLQYHQSKGMVAAIKIKLEIDTNPPNGGTVERKTVDFPYLSPVIVQDLPSLFAGKLHALLCRSYLKGRDWYDFIWYTARRVGVNYPYLAAALHQSGPYAGIDEDIDRKWLISELEKKIASIDFSQAAADVRRFVSPMQEQALRLWENDVFISQLAKIP